MLFLLTERVQASVCFAKIAERFPVVYIYTMDRP